MRLRKLLSLVVSKMSSDIDEAATSRNLPVDVSEHFGRLMMDKFCLEIITRRYLVNFNMYDNDLLEKNI